MLEDSNKKIYEVGYHAMPTLSEEELAKVVEGLKATLSKLGASIIADQYPNSMTLAYEIVKEIDNKNRKFGTAFFGWVKFEMAGEQLAEFNTVMEKNPTILRFMVIKTVRESTLAVPKLAHKGMTRRAVPDAETAAPMDADAVDQKIDEMVTQEATAETL